MDKIIAQNNGSVKDYLASLNEQTGKSSQVLIEMMQRISGHEPTLWNAGTIGFDTYHYKYSSGREGNGHVLGFYPRKGKITVYLMDGMARYAELLAKLGKHTTTGYCVHQAAQRCRSISVVLINKRHLDGFTSSLLHCLSQFAYLSALLLIGGSDQQAEQMSQDVHGNVDLASLASFRSIVTSPIVHNLGSIAAFGYRGWLRLVGLCIL